MLDIVSCLQWPHPYLRPCSMEIWPIRVKWSVFLILHQSVLKICFDMHIQVFPFISISIHSIKPFYDLFRFAQFEFGWWCYVNGICRQEVPSSTSTSVRWFVPIDWSIHLFQLTNSWLPMPPFFVLFCLVSAWPISRRTSHRLVHVPFMNLPVHSILSSSSFKQSTRLIVKPITW